MECNSTVNGSTKKKAKACEHDAIDTFELLSEYLISSILSLLPTKDAVRTSVLSKTWIHRWESITKIDINDSLFYSPNGKSSKSHHFINFVQRVLNNTSVECCSLAISNMCEASRLVRWILLILNKKVKKLHVETVVPLHFSLDASRSLFNCISLEELVLKMFSCVINVPINYVCFGNIKLLKLCGILFSINPSGGSTCLTLFLPVLKKFEARHCIWLSGEGITIKAPLLESIFVEQDTYGSNRNLISIPTELLRCAITFFDCHLTEFTYRGYFISHPLILSDPSSTRNASANIRLDKYEEDMVPAPGFDSLMLINQFSQAKSIKVDGLKVHAQAVTSVLPVFTMLIHLEFGFVGGEVLWGFLQKSPVLKTLVIKDIFSFDTELLNSAAKPDCLVSSLQDVKFENTYGSEHELFIAKLLIENGMVLQTMSFTPISPSEHNLVLKEFKKKLFSFQKASPSLVLNFQD